MEDYPRLAGEFRDGDGRPPRHSFFFPGEEYSAYSLDSLADLARAGLGEVELHLHHHDDTSQNLRADIERYLRLYAGHGHLSREGERLRYGFIHGNWCLANSRRDGQWCGVDDELPILFETGCYADFTFPSAPDESQPGMVNQIYWPAGDLSRRRSYENGMPARVGERLDDRILMIEGPLSLSFHMSRRRPLRLDAGAILANNQPTPDRVRNWVAQEIHVEGRPEWIFVKIHIHGAQEAQADAYLGEGGRMLHRELTGHFNDGRHWKLHYVSAREMFNVAIAAMDGRTGDPADYLDFRLAPPPVCAA
jgi:hypothetical protein